MIIRRRRVRVEIEQTTVSLTTVAGNVVAPTVPASDAESPPEPVIHPATDPLVIASAVTLPAELFLSQPATSPRHTALPFDQETR